MLQLISGPEKELLEKLQVVVIDCPYNTLSDPLTQKLFAKFISMKLNGFVAEYGHGALPLGSYDFIGTLIMLCEKNATGELEPVFCFKSSTLQRTKYFRLPFELTDWLDSPASAEHQRCVTDIVNRAERDQIHLGYNSSWTIAPAWRTDPLKKNIAKSLSVALFTNYYQTYQIQEILIGGVAKFKVDKIQAYLGFEYLQTGGVNLSPVDVKFIKGEQAILMHLRTFSAEAIALKEKYQSIWDARLTIEDNSQMSGKKAA